MFRLKKNPGHAIPFHNASCIISWGSCLSVCLVSKDTISFITQPWPT